MKHKVLSNFIHKLITVLAERFIRIGFVTADLKNKTYITSISSIPLPPL